MKTMFRILVLGAGVFTVVLCMGSKEDEAKADVPATTTEPTLELAAAPTPAPRPDDAPIIAGNTNVATASAGSTADTNAASLKVSTNILIAATVPDSLTLSKPMTDIVKLVQAGVSEQVLMAFIASAAEPFDAGSNEIIYLHDLGVSSNLITALIQHDSAPEVQARKQAASAVKPLPPGVALNTPATNIYTPKEKMIAEQNPPDPQPVVAPSGAADSTYAPAPAAPVSTVEVQDDAFDTGTATTVVNNSYWYSSLAPYGSWVDVGGYGACWRPTVAVCSSTWRPYADSGRWLWSNAGWYWYSDYTWGWGPFHYGRWACPTGVGWVWVPGNTWGPSWVSWRSTASYCGWAPLPPAACYVPRSGFYFNTASVGIGCDFGLAASAYVFLPVNRFCDRRPYNYYVTGGHAQTVFKDSTVNNNYVVGNNNTIINHGVGVDRVAQATRGDIRQVALKDTTALRDLGPRREKLASDGATLAVHRPSAETIARGGAVPAPGRTGAASSSFRPRGDRPADGAAGNSVAAPFSAVNRHTGARPGVTAPSREPITQRRSDSPIDLAKLTSPASATVPNPAPANGSAITRPGSSFTSRPNTPVTAGSGSAAKPGPSSIVMRNPNPNRSGANRPVTYPFVPAPQSPAAPSAAPAQTRPGYNSPSTPRSSFVPGPPAASPRANYSAPTAPTRNYSAPSYAAPPRSAPAAPAASAARVESQQHSVSVPAPSPSRGSQSSGRGSDGGSVSSGGFAPVGRGR